MAECFVYKLIIHNFMHKVKVMCLAHREVVQVQTAVFLLFILISPVFLTLFSLRVAFVMENLSLQAYEWIFIQCHSSQMLHSATSAVLPLVTWGH